MSANTQIGTANKRSVLHATHTGKIELYTRSGHCIQHTAMFVPGLRDNLISVGRVCNGVQTVVFNTCGSKIYDNKGLKVVGKELHSESRDKSSGMYPLTLLPYNTYVFHATTRQDQEDQAFLSGLLVTAQPMLLKEKTRPQGAKVSVLDLPEHATCKAIAALGRLYVREDLDEADRWHLKCGHVSMKSLKRYQEFSWKETP